MTHEERIIEQYDVKHINGIVTEPCSRCGGTGEYSFNLWDGTRCFKCRGSRVQHTKLKTVIRRIRGRELAEERRQKALELEKGVEIAVTLDDLRSSGEAMAARQRAAEVARMHYFGTIGGKIDEELQFVHCAGFETRFGWTNVYIFEDPKTKSSAVWFTSSYQEINNADHKGMMVRVRGTVKDHDKYKGKPQTKLNRCKLELLELVS